MERIERGWRAVLVMASLLATAAVGRAQVSGHELQLADAGPRFLAAPSLNDPAAPVRDVRDAAVFRRRIAVDFHRTPLGVVLADIAQQAGLHLTVSPAVVAVTSPVSFSAPGITVGAALTAVLYDAGVDVQLSSDGIAIAVVPRMANAAMVGSRRRQSAGRIAGRVTDAVTGQAMLNATVVVDNGGYRATTKNDGWFTIAGVPVGAHTVTVRLLGHAPLSKPVEVRPDTATRLDFALAEAAAALEQVVTTATGDERRFEVGNVVATINADSIAKTAPVTDLTDVIAGRAPNVEVLASTGQVGGGPRIRIRGLSSPNLPNDPIFYVDGVRVDGSPGTSNGSSVCCFEFPAPSRLNDIDPSEVASIDVLKGPSAAALYGTDAANGVVVIKTHRGQAGAPRWSVTGEHGLSAIPGPFPDRWYSWGHTTDGSQQAVNCTRVPGYWSPYSVGAGNCAIDSVTRFQPLNNPSTTLFGQGYRNRLSGQVSGGAQQTQYFVSGSFTDEVGPSQLPPVFAQRLQVAGQATPNTLLRPNAADDKTVHARLTTALGGRADLSLSGGYVSGIQRSADEFSAVFLAVDASGRRDSVGQGYAYFGLPQDPTPYLQNRSSQGISRFTGGTTLTWNPAAWFTGHATGGIDAGSQSGLTYRPVGPDPTFFTYGSTGATLGGGYRGLLALTTGYYTADIGASIFPSLGNAWSTRTAFGLQYNDRRQNGTLDTGFGLGPSGSLTGAAVQFVSDTGWEAITLGAYLEETVGFHDRLYLTAALRDDAGSGFGKQANAALYPKASVSWVAWRNGEDIVRIRGAYGASGVQPLAGATLSLYHAVQIPFHNQTVSADTISTAGNATLKPERQTEVEGGVDATLLHGRVQLEATYYNKASRDALIPVTLPTSFGTLTRQENVGSVSNDGVEGSVTAEIIQGGTFSWIATVNAAANHNRLVSLAPGAPSFASSTGGVIYRQQPGYPLFSFWGYGMSIVDANHDGIVEPNEVTITSSQSFLGQPTPKYEVSLNTSVSLWRGRVQLGTQIAARGGNKLFNLAQVYSDDQGAPAVNDPHAKLSDQARAVVISLAYPVSGYVQDASFVRWRELTVTYVAPAAAARLIGAASATVGVGVRNLALWSRYPGMDPEVNGIVAPGVPSDAAYDSSVVPQMRSLLIRLSFAY